MWCRLVTRDEIIIDENVKQVDDCQHHEKKEYENDDPTEDL